MGELQRLQLFMYLPWMAASGSKAAVRIRLNLYNVLKQWTVLRKLVDTS